MRDDLRANTNRQSLWAIPLAWLQSPGFAVVVSWRLAHRLNRRGPLARFLAAVIWRYFVARHGCYISLSATIGQRLRLPHPVGIVIGDAVDIGDDVTIYQNVTLGRATKTGQDYPRIRDQATLFAAATVIGSVQIGRSATVGANSLVLTDVPDGLTAVGIPARVLQTRRDSNS